MFLKVLDFVCLFSVRYIKQNLFNHALFVFARFTIFKNNMKYVIICVCKFCQSPQKLSEETAADKCYQSYSKELCCLPETQELAMVALIH